MKNTRLTAQLMKSGLAASFPLKRKVSAISLCYLGSIWDIRAYLALIPVFLGRVGLVSWIRLFREGALGLIRLTLP
jgi:hypothetical protein